MSIENKSYQKYQEWRAPKNDPKELNLSQEMVLGVSFAGVGKIFPETKEIALLAAPDLGDVYRWGDLKPNLESNGFREHDLSHTQQMLGLMVELMRACPELLEEAKLDLNKCVLQIIIHDWPEKHTGDYCRDAANCPPAAVKFEQELEAMEKILAGVSDVRLKRLIIDIFHDYHDRQNLESKLVKLCDCFDGDITYINKFAPLNLHHISLNELSFSRRRLERDRDLTLKLMNDFYLQIKLFQGLSTNGLRKLEQYLVDKMSFYEQKILAVDRELAGRKADWL